MNPQSTEIARYAGLDARMVRAARGLRLLSLVSWPASVQEAFLAGWRRGEAVLPRHEYPRHDFGDARRELDAIAAEAGAGDLDHPRAHYLVESARDWNLAAQLLESLGKPRAGEPQSQPDGRP